MNQENQQEYLRQLAHDAHHCLHVIGMAAEILKNAPSESNRDTELLNSIDKERRKAAELLDELIAVARQCGK